MRNAALLLLIPLQAGAFRSPCERAPLSTEASAFAWSDHSQVAYPSSDTIAYPRRHSPEGANFRLVIYLAPGSQSPSAVEVRRGKNSWRTDLEGEGPDQYRADSVAFHTVGVPPMWLDHIDSLDVCLTFGEAHDLRIIRLPRIDVHQTS